MVGGDSEGRDSSTEDRSAGWFVESRGERLPSGKISLLQSTVQVITVIRVLGVALLILGLYFALAPWSDCGIPIMGRYDRGSPPDLAATAFTTCWNQAQGRRHWGAIFIGAGVLVLASCAVDLIIRWGQSRANR